MLELGSDRTWQGTHRPHYRLPYHTEAISHVASLMVAPLPALRDNCVFSVWRWREKALGSRLSGGNFQPGL